MADFKFVDEKHPEGFAWNKFKVKTEGERADLVIPCLVSWGKNVSEPDVDDEGRKKWSVGFAIPKEGAEELMAQLREAEEAIVRTAGVKGAFPSCFRDGAAKDGSGMYVKSRGALADFWYGTAKTRKAPRVIERGDGSGFLDIDPGRVVGGGYCMLSTSMVVLGYGSDSKKGSSLWFDRILWLGGGNQIAGGSSMSDEDAFDFSNVVSNGAKRAKAESFI